MGSRSWCKVILLLVVLAGLLHRARAAAGECRDQSQSCDEWYDTLADSLVNMHNNKYHLRRVFYPLERVSPVFVTVTYQYNDSSIRNRTWYWGAGVFYFLQPLELFQFTSLFFGNPSWRSDELTLTLPAECASAPEGFMTELTQQLKLYASQLTHNPTIDNTYKAKGFNLVTLKRDLYTDVTFDVDHLKLLLCFQVLFPFLVIILVIMYSCCWLIKKYDQDNQNEQGDSWAIIIAHAIISSTFILYVIALDIAGLIFRDGTPEYHSQSYNGLLYHYPIPVLLWDIIAVIITIFVGLPVMCAHGKNTFLLLKIAGVVPLLVLASHAHYIIIAWITDPLYATGIGINYAIFYVIHLVMLKQSCKRTKKRYGSSKSDTCQQIFEVLAVPAVWFVSLSFQVLVTVFFVYIPINHSIEDTPSTLLTIIQGTGAVFLGLIAWKVVVDPRGNDAQQKVGTLDLSIISGALRTAIKNNDPNRKLHSDPEWAKFDDEKKLAEVLCHIIPLQLAPAEESTARQ